MTRHFLHLRDPAGDHHVVADDPSDYDRKLCIQPTPIRLSVADAGLPLQRLIERYRAGDLKADTQAKNIPCRIHKTVLCPDQAACLATGCTASTPDRATADTMTAIDGKEITRGHANAVRRQTTRKVRACRSCGCTDDRACEGGCWWVEKDLCSACQLRGEAP